MSFLFPTLLTIGLPLVAVPILIHLINLRRQQRIRWAAMQFLLESQQRNRRWVLLKQLLLLATRMAVVAVLVLMLAHLVLRNEWLSLLGRGTTHHLVLLDDSYSMSDRWDDTTRTGRRQTGRPGHRRPGRSAIRHAAHHAAAIFRSRRAFGRRTAESLSPNKSTTRSAASWNRCSPAGSPRKPTSAPPTR